MNLRLAVIALACSLALGFSGRPGVRAAETGRGTHPIVLAQSTLSTTGTDRLSWVGDEVMLNQRALEHRHEAGFVYAAVTPARISIAGKTTTLKPGQATFIGDGVAHTHLPTCNVPTDCRDSFWEIRLSRADGAARLEPAAGKRIFVSPALSPLPPGPLRVLLEEIPLPPGARLVTPSGAGPEYVYVRQGDVAYRAGGEGASSLHAGQGHVAPAGITVETRNEAGRPASVLAFSITR